MSIIFIGDRGVGKTTLVTELADSSKAQFVKVINPSLQEIRELCERKQQEDGREIYEAIATTNRQVTELKITVDLPTGKKRNLDVKWIDTPGELWENNQQNTQENSSDQWKEVLTYLQTAKGIILVLSPQGNRLKSSYLRQETQDPRQRFLHYEAWIKRFQSWLNFLNQYVKIGQQVIICLNKADLICDDCEEITQELPFAPATLDIKKIQDYLLKNYFQEVQEQIARYNKINQGNSLKVFLTSKDNRILLESPWIYLGRIIRNEQ